MITTDHISYWRTFAASLALWFICGRPRLAMAFGELLIGRFHMSGLFCAERLFRWP